MTGVGPYSISICCFRNNTNSLPIANRSTEDSDNGISQWLECLTQNWNILNSISSPSECQLWASTIKMSSSHNSRLPPLHRAPGKGDPLNRTAKCLNRTMRPGRVLNLCGVRIATLLFQGIQVNDLIMRFGSVTKANFKSLQDIALVVQHSKDVSGAMITWQLLFMLELSFHVGFYWEVVVVCSCWEIDPAETIKPQPVWTELF